MVYSNIVKKKEITIALIAFLFGLGVMYFYNKTSLLSTKINKDNFTDSGFISFEKEKAELFKSLPQGSGGFIAYMLIVNKNGISKIVYQKDGLYQGSVNVVGDTIEEVTGSPLPNDSNCCPSYYKYRYISFSNGKPEVVREFQESSKDIGNIPKQATEIQINYQETVLNGVDEIEEEKIKEFIGTFEKYYSNSTGGFRYRKSAKEMFSLFISPESKEEQEEVNGYLGDFGNRIGDDNDTTFLYTSHGYNHSHDMHYVRKIAKTSTIVKVYVDELRTYQYNGATGELATSGVTANIQSLIFELKKTPEGYKIAKYYHEGKNSKYDGLTVN